MKTELFRLELLEGKQVRLLVGAEMALSDEGPVWSDPAVPCLQLTTLYFCLENDQTVKLASFHNDHGAEFLLEESSAPELDEGAAGDIYRTRNLNELGSGKLKSVTTEGQDGVEVWHFQLGSAEIVLVAGEVEDEGDGYRFRRPDESILVFSPPERLDLIDWD